MKHLSKTFITALAVTILVAIPSLVLSWGFFAHKLINRKAVFTLPPQMIGFYKRNLLYLSEHSVDPDKRRHLVEGEAERHYIDIDHYIGDSLSRFNEIPESWKDASAKYGEDTLKKYGVLPWHLSLMLHKLTEAFKEEDPDRILKLSADIGHYIGDAHVPLHTTQNYNGQLTGQKGIHGLWESRIPELKSTEYNYLTGRAEYIANPQKYIWKIIRQSFAAKDSVLLFERELTKKFNSDKKYSYESKGTTTSKVYSEAFVNAYNEMLSGMVERRLRSSIHAVGSFWFTAWVNAGQPDLKKMTSHQKSEEKEEQGLKKVKADREHEEE